MKSRSSIIDISLSDSYFAVYPLTIQFERQYKTKFYFYFEKGLQIISKYESPVQSFKKNEVAYFNSPQEIQHFRCQSEKNLEYNWSLYIYRVDIDGDNEEFVEGQKINLKDKWNEYKTLKKNCFECQIQFSTMRCKLSYLVIIGNNNSDLLQKSQKYFNQNKASILTNTEQKVITIPQNSEVQQKVQEKQPKIIQSNEQIESAAVITENTVEFFKQKVEHGEQIKSTVQQFHVEHPQNENDKINIQFQQEEGQKKDGIKQINLSPAQMEIGELIQQDIIEKQSKSEEPILQGTTEKSPLLKQITLENTEQGNIRMTNSHLIDSKGEIIVPFYKKKKIIGLFIVIILILIAAGYFTLSKSVSPIENQQKQKKQGKKKEKEKIEKVEKPQKNKGKTTKSSGKNKK